MPIPIPFSVFQTTPGQNFPKPLFGLHAYSLEQAREAKVAGETIVVAVALRKGRERLSAAGLMRSAQRAAL
ncbi:MULTISPECIES: hypothetical protein [Bradyrhizobium]|uniref:hypothetical protein n=1 Tax=Bradyrhizobium TaxID=374 RepID=UPI0004BB426F|nr:MULTISPECIES: hypothetical protein [Bradyrhizobium]MBR1366546.1 hypothetical protein [Bradyrhizobium ottawaense]